MKVRGGIFRYMETYEVMWGYMGNIKVYEGMWMYMRVYEGMWGV